VTFPEGFVWGAASSSYQIEGAAFEDGKGPSVWDVMGRRPGVIWQGQSGEVACDHYHRYQEDVALMRELRLPAYRFSISWPRVIPDGTGAVNRAGLAFYDRLVDALLAAGVTPYATLFHWDYPYELFCRGGWLSAESPDWFAHYAGVVVERLSDRVTHWLTLNEPQVFLSLGHLEGVDAPGERLGFAEVLRATHHVLLAHGKAVQAIRSSSKRPCLVGAATVGPVSYPATGEPADIDAARDATFRITEPTLWSHTWFSDPMLRSEYPADGMELFGRDVPQVRATDMDAISSPLDFYGLNVYHGTPVRAGRDGKPEQVPFPDGFPISNFRWPVTPEALYWAPRFLSERYGLPVIITENGFSGLDWLSLDGRVHDPQRIDFAWRYLRALGRAIDDGVDVRGYFHWALTDNFEWAEGFKHRFGLIHVDLQTQKRTVKDSGYWYRDVIATNGADLA
jgi:beta-glucosidase